MTKDLQESILKVSLHATMSHLAHRILILPSLSLFLTSLLLSFFCRFRWDFEKIRGASRNKREKRREAKDSKTGPARQGLSL